MTTLCRRFFLDEEGQDLIEYALIAALIAVAAIGILRTLAAENTNIFGQVAAALGS